MTDHRQTEQSLTPAPETGNQATGAALLAWINAMLVAVWLEAHRLGGRLVSMATTGWWLGDPDPDATFLLPLLAFAPFCWLFSLSGMPRACRRAVSFVPAGQWPLRRHVLMCVVISLCSLSASMAVRQQSRSGLDTPATFGQIAPLIHDEFSYLLQAKTILAGRWFWAGPQRAPELFHQMHVLNEGRFASRYLPGTGLWIAPWLWLGQPHWGHWLAGAFVSVLVYAIGLRLGGRWVGVLAGLLTAVSPGLALFNNLLLAHQPGLVGLMVFLLAFLLWMEQPRFPTALVSGAGLAFAMLCRPLTAASMALPFGVYFLVRGIGLLRPYLFRIPLETGGADAAPVTETRLETSRQTSRHWWQGAVGLGLPLCIGFAVMGLQNQALTGDVWTTPYSLYTRLYTPRHVYGFQNGTRGDLRQSEQVLVEYDRWAENLTLSLAVENFGKRFVASLSWTLGIVPLALAVVFFLLTAWDHDVRLWLIFLSILSLHVMHLPYWVTGMLDYHYAFESGPLWLLLFASMSVRLLRSATRSARPLFVVWWGLLVAVSIAVNYLPFTPTTTVPRIHRGVSRLAFVADRYQRFMAQVAHGVTERPALILVETTPADLHVEYVRNEPPFDGELLVGTWRSKRYSLSQLKALFPERAIYRYQSSTGTIEKLVTRSGPADSGTEPIDGEATR